MAYFTERPLNEKESKNLRIYKLLRDKREVSRADLTAITKINPVSISNYINSFIKKGLVNEKEVGISSGGRPPIILELNKNMSQIIGVYISKYTIKGIVVDLGVKKMARLENPYDPNDPNGAVKNMIEALMPKVDPKYLRGISVAEEEVSLNIPAIERSLEDTIRMPIYSCKASLAAAYAEYVISDNYTENKVLYSYKDVGDCIFLDNFNFYSGRDTEEITGYLRPWDELMGVENVMKKSAGTGHDKEITAISVYEAAQKNNSEAEEILENAGITLGVRLAYLLNMFRPKIIVLGGGVEHSGKAFIESVKESVAKLALDGLVNNIEITYSGIEDEDAAAIGAAALTVRELFIGV